MKSYLCNEKVNFEKFYNNLYAVNIESVTFSK
jgi:hypothetical protein